MMATEASIDAARTRPLAAPSDVGAGSSGGVEAVSASLSDRAYWQIRDMIVSGRLEPGAQVHEADLVRLLGMSRTPIRDALRRLEATGYLRPMPQRGFLVTEMTADQLSHVYEVRAVLEGLAARQAARSRTRVDIAELETIIEQMDMAIEHDGPLAGLNRQFHAKIARASGNAYLETMLAGIQEVFERSRTAAVTHPQRSRDAHQEHHKLLEAVTGGDDSLAAALATDHVMKALAFRLDRVAPQPSISRAVPTDGSTS